MKDLTRTAMSWSLYRTSWSLYRTSWSTLL